MWTEAAPLLQSVVKNHPLVDGNKRLGWLATAVFLELNGIAATEASDDDVDDLMIHVAATDVAATDVAATDVDDAAPPPPTPGGQRLRRKAVMPAASASA